MAGRGLLHHWFRYFLRLMLGGDGHPKARGIYSMGSLEVKNVWKRFLLRALAAVGLVEGFQSISPSHFSVPSSYLSVHFCIVYVEWISVCVCIRNDTQCYV